MSSRPIRVCRLEDLALGKPQRFEVESATICVVRCADGVHAVSDICSHEDVSLSEGDVDVEACEIECWKHGSLFSLVSGEPLCLPATQPVSVYAVEVRDGDVEVLIDEDSVRQSRARR